jgi:hypothetical protein
MRKRVRAWVTSPSGIAAIITAGIALLTLIALLIAAPSPPQVPSIYRIYCP